MTDQSSSQGQPDDWSRGRYVPGEQYAGEQYYGAGSYGSSRSGPGMPAPPIWQDAPGRAGPAQAGPAQAGPAQIGPAQIGPAQGAPGRGAPPPGESQAMGVPQTADTRGFLSALYDFSFTSFVTTRIIKVLYVLILILVCISALVYTIVAFRVSAGFGLLTLLIGDPLFIIIVMALWRLVLESFVVRFRIAEDVRALRERDDR